MFGEGGFSLNNLLFALAVAAVAWFLMRHAQRAKARRAARKAAAAAAPAKNPGTMPRLGTPGTITRAQISHLRKNDFDLSTDLSAEEATLVLYALAYARLALIATTGRRKHSIEAQNEVLAFLLRDDALRGYMLDWGRASADAGHSDNVAIEPNEHLKRVVAFIRALPDGATR